MAKSQNSKVTVSIQTIPGGSVCLTKDRLMTEIVAQAPASRLALAMASLAGWGCRLDISDGAARMYTLLPHSVAAAVMASLLS